MAEKPLYTFSVSLVVGDLEAFDPEDAARRFRLFCLEADQHSLTFEVHRHHPDRVSEITHITLEEEP